MRKKVIKRYSIAFKKQVVREYEAGSSLNSLQQRYGIGGDHTVSRWLEQYGREGLRHKLMYIQQPDEQARMKALEARVKELESTLAQAALVKVRLHHGYSLVGTWPPSEIATTGLDNMVLQKQNGLAQS